MPTGLRKFALRSLALDHLIPVGLERFWRIGRDSHNPISDPYSPMAHLLARQVNGFHNTPIIWRDGFCAVTFIS
jgi:hypothetical protein